MPPVTESSLEGLVRAPRNAKEKGTALGRAVRIEENVLEELA